MKSKNKKPAEFLSLRRTPILALAILLVLLVLGGCSQPGQETDNLVVYSGRSETLIAPLVAMFSEKYGVDVSVKYGKTGEIAAVLLEEEDKSPADIFLAQDPGGLGVIANASMLRILDDNILNKVPIWAKSPDGIWVGLSGRARVVVYNTDNLTPDDMPKDIYGFTDPSWKGRLGWAPSNGSFQAMVTAMRVMWGDDKTADWLVKINANKPRVYPKNTPIVKAASLGEIDAGFVNHYYLHRFISEEGEDFAARNHYLASGGPGSMVLVAGAGVLKTAVNTANAEKFLTFMLSMDAQQYFTDKTFEYPLNKKHPLIDPHDGLISMSNFDNPNIDMASLEDLQGTIKMLRELGILN